MFVTDGGLETTLVFHEGIDLPCFAAFTLLSDDRGRAQLDAYFRRYIEIARSYGVGFILESVTWRANPDWGGKLGYDAEALATANRDAIAMLEVYRDEFEDAKKPMVISGCVGPRGDGYDPGEAMDPSEAQDYHAVQVGVFAQTAADMVTGITMTNTPEATGFVRAARQAEVPVVVSFTVETDGRLPTGQSLGEAVREVDAATDGYTAYYMINCAHPTHFEGVLSGGGDWLSRVKGVRVNASMKSHAELDEATELDDGDPVDLGRRVSGLRRVLPGLNVLGGCCGTDHRHVQEICKAWVG